MSGGQIISLISPFATRDFISVRTERNVSCTQIHGFELQSTQLPGQAEALQLAGLALRAGGVLHPLDDLRAGLVRSVFDG